MIDDTLVAELERRVEALRDRRWESVRYEIQDDGLFLLVTVEVAVSQSEKENLGQIFQLIGQVCRELIPPRPDDYSWMIAIERYGKMIDSISGGATEIPHVPPS